AALEARLDGAVAISRVPYPIESPRAQTAAVRLLSGRHHVLVRWSRAEGTRFRLTLARADGDVSDLSSAAPKDLSGARAAAFCELGQPCVSPPAWRDRADLRARLTAAAVERDAERFDDAQQELDRAEAVLREEKAPPSPRLLAARARLLDARGNSAGARARAEEALRAAPGRCDTLQLLLDLSRRGGSLSDQRAYAEGLVGCPDGVASAAQAARS